MLFITESVEDNYTKSDKDNIGDSFINDKKFTVKNTPLTYRQINTLDEDNLLGIDRGNVHGWRKFSFKELVYLTLIKELKGFGLQHNQLRELSKFFLSKDTSYFSTLSIGCVLGHIEMTITIDSEGKTTIFDPYYYVMLRTNSPHIKICLNDIVNKFALSMGKPPFPIKYSVENVYFERESFPKESELIKIIRDNQYSTITIKKKTGDSYIIHAEKAKSSNDDLSNKDILEILKAKDFQDISIIKRDGKIVSHRIEEAIKL